MGRENRFRVLRRILLLGSAAGLAVTLHAAPVAAQTGNSDRVEDALHETDAGIERAQTVVGESESQRARELLQNAVRIQDEAWGQFRSRVYVAASRLTLEARGLASRAVAFAREDDSLQNRARHEAEKALRALSRARELAGDSSDPQVARLLEQAASMIERARVKYGEQHYQAALRLSVSAQQLIRQALGMLGDGSVDGSPRVLRELERTDHLIDRTQPVVEESGSSEALRMFQHGRDVQSRAWEAYRADAYRAAMARTGEARDAVNRARMLAHGPLGPDGVAKALAETERLLEHAFDVVTDSGNEPALAVLERARSHQGKAQRFLDAGELRKALAETRVARSLAKRALRLIDRDDLR